MNRLVCLVFVSLQIAPLLGLSAEDYNPERTIHGRPHPTLVPQKCCSLKQMYSTEHENCTDVTPALLPKVQTMLPFLGSSGHFNCSSGMMIILNDLEGQNYTLLENGSLYEPVRSMVHPRDRYCYDYMLEHGRYMPMICIEPSEIEIPVDESVGSNESEHGKSVRSDKSEHGKSVESDKSAPGKLVGSGESEHRKSVGSDKSEHGKSVRSDKFEYGKSVGSDKSEYGKSVGSDKSEHGKSIKSDKPEHGNLIGSGKSEHRKSVGSDKSEHGKLVRSNKFEHGKSVGSDKSEHGKSVGSDKSEHGKSIKSDKPEHGNLIGSGKSEHRKSVGSDKSEHGKLVRSNKFEHGKSVGSDKSEHGKSVGSDKSEHGKSIKSDKPKHGNLIGSGKSEHRKSVGSDKSEHGKLVRSNKFEHGKSVESDKSEHGKSVGSDKSEHGKSIKSDKPKYGKLIGSGKSGQGKSVGSNISEQGKSVRPDKFEQEKPIKFDESQHGKSIGLSKSELRMLVGSNKLGHKKSFKSDKSVQVKLDRFDRSKVGNSVTQKSPGRSDSKKSESHSRFEKLESQQDPNYNNPKATGSYDQEEPGNGPTYDRSSEYSLLVLGLSTLLLFITLSVFVIEPDLHYYQFDLSFIGHLTSLIIGLGSIIASHNWHTCGILAYTRQFAILFSFSWLNVMGIHIWRSMDLSGDRRKLNGRCHIAFLFLLVHPFSVLIFTYLANETNFLNVFGFVFNNSCWFRHCREYNPFWLNPEFIYFYINVLVMLCFNLGLFVIIAFKVLFQNFGWRPDAEQNGRTTDHLYIRFGLCCKIFFVMGLIWFADVTAFFVENEELKWYLRNLTVFIHSFCIFINFMGSNRVIHLFLRSSSVGQKIKTMHYKNVVYIPDGTTPRVMMI